MQYYVVISPTIEKEPFQMGSNGSSLLILMIFLLFNIEEHNILRLNITNLLVLLRLYYHPRMR